jgi:CheY-like chemotaxis protein
MGGTIDVSSVVGKGSEFVIEVPLQLLEAPGLELAATKGISIVPDHEADRVWDFSGRRVLVAEDNSINAEIVVELLKLRHLDAELATDGAQAVALFRSQPPHHYDAVLMDIRMPVLDGLAATRAIRDSGRPDSLTIPIIAMTANAFEEDLEQSRHAGMDMHLSKPVDPQLLYDTLYHFIFLGRKKEENQ